MGAFLACDVAASAASVLRRRAGHPASRDHPGRHLELCFQLPRYTALMLYDESASHRLSDSTKCTTHMGRGLGSYA